MRCIYCFFASVFVLVIILWNAGCSAGPDFGKCMHDNNDVFGVMAFADYDENNRLFFRTDEDLALIPNETMEDSELIVSSKRYFLDYESVSEIIDNSQEIFILGIHEVEVKSIGVMPEQVKPYSNNFEVQQIWRTSKYLNVKYMSESEDNVHLSICYDDGDASDSTVTELDLYLVPDFDYKERNMELSSNVHFVSFGIEVLKQRLPLIKKYNIKDSKGKTLLIFGS